MGYGATITTVIIDVSPREAASTLPVYLSICLSVGLSVGLSIFLSIFLSVSWLSLGCVCTFLNYRY